MKRVYIFLLAVCVLCIMTACDSKQASQSKGEELSQITVYGDTYMNNTFIQAEILDNSPISKVEDRKIAEKVIMIMGEEYTGSYETTVTYPSIGIVADAYKIGTKEEDRVLLYEDGSIFMIQNNLTTLDIQPTDPPETVKEKLCTELSEFIDYEKYQYWKVSRSYPEEEETFGAYNFVFYNEHEGYRTSYTSAFVFEDGRTTAVWIVDPVGTDVLDFHIDKALEEKIIWEKLCAILGEGVSLKDYSCRSTGAIVKINGEYCVKYLVDITAEDDSGTSKSCVNIMVIPVKLIIAES